jgi:hypothetical protein
MYSIKHLEPVNWIGLPHEIGADPRYGKACCCLVANAVVNEQKHQYFPTHELANWIQLSHEGDWKTLEAAFETHTKPVTLAECRRGDVAILHHEQGLGLATVLDYNWILLPFHDCGVRVGPRRLWSHWDIRRPTA